MSISGQAYCREKNTGTLFLWTNPHFDTLFGLFSKWVGYSTQLYPDENQVGLQITQFGTLVFYAILVKEYQDELLPGILTPLGFFFGVI